MAKPHDKSPGPCAYTAKHLGSTAGTIFGSEARDRQTFDAVPGPGGYEPHTNTRTGPKYPFPTSTRNDSRSLKASSPGPDAYTQPGTLSTLGARITPKRQDLSSKLGIDTPGPAMYMLGAKNCRGVTFGKSKRGSSGKGTGIEAVLGPGVHS
jgi:hypothetical protein